MAIRAGTARSVVLYLKLGLSVQEAVRAAADDLGAARWRYRGVVTIYAFDRDERHQVTTYSRSDEGSDYWIWRDGMQEPEQRTGETLRG